MNDWWAFSNTVRFDDNHIVINVGSRIRRDSDPKLFDYIPFYLMENTSSHYEASTKMTKTSTTSSMMKMKYFEDTFGEENSESSDR